MDRTKAKIDFLGCRSVLLRVLFFCFVLVYVFFFVSWESSECVSKQRRTNVQRDRLKEWEG